MKVSEISDVLKQHGFDVHRFVGTTTRLYRFTTSDAVYSVHADHEDNVLDCQRISSKTMNTVQLKKHLKTFKED